MIIFKHHMPLSLLLIALVMTVSCSAPRVITVDSKEQPLVVDSAPPRQTAETFESTNYLLYLPENYGQSGKRWPLILSLHGGRHRGNHVERLKEYGLAAQLEKDLSIPFIVVSPQCPENLDWTDQETVLVRLVDDIASKYSVDAGRIYVTGFSMGGRGTWNLAAKYPEKFAAFVPLADVPVDLELARQVGKVPVWFFQGTKDHLIPIAKARRFVDLIKANGGEIRFTELPEAGHMIVDTYANKEIYDWMLQHKRG